MEEELIYSYTRAQALEDGELVDVSETARQAGFVWPVAVTRALWQDITAIPSHLEGIASIDGRLWDVLWMAFCAIKRSQDTDGTHLIYELIMPVDDGQLYTAMLVSGPGDQGEPVITLMNVGES